MDRILDFALAALR